MGKLPTLPMALAPTRTILAISSSSTSTSTSASTTSRSPSSLLTPHQTRHASFIARPRRPYTFTQLIQLSDGSTYTARTTSPLPLYRATKDTRNTLLWQPSEKSLRNVELDEAGKLAAFRERFGRGFDASAQAAEEDGGAEGGAEQASAQAAAADDGFADLLAEFAPQDTSSLKDSGPKKSPTRRK